MEVEVISDSQLRLLVGFARRIHKRIYGRVRRRFPSVQGSFNPRWKPVSSFGADGYIVGFSEVIRIQYRSSELSLCLYKPSGGPISGSRSVTEEIFPYCDAGFLDRLYADVLLAAGGVEKHEVS